LRKCQLFTACADVLREHVSKLVELAIHGARVAFMRLTVHGIFSTKSNFPYTIEMVETLTM
jgi:hypothetical protein